jgi:Zn-dependent metalloprotease
MTRRNRPLATMLAASLLSISSASQAQTYDADPFANRESAKYAATLDTFARPHLDRAMSLRTNLGLDGNHTFQVVNASMDDLGGSHARLQQYYAGVKVEGGILISHVDAAGTYSYTDSLERNLSLSVTPRLSQQSALDIVATQPSHRYPYSWTPRTELVIYPVKRQLNARTGEPATDSGLPHFAPDVIPEETNAEDYIWQVSSYNLAWHIRTVEGREGFAEQQNAMEYLVDANTGALLLERSALHSAVGSGSGKWSGAVTFNTTAIPGGFRMFDAARNYATWDDDTGKSSAVNTDGNNIWGDGKSYAGDWLASVDNRQTAMVDAHFNAGVYWDLMSNVFGRQGPDDKLYDVNVYVHVGSNWANASYSHITGNISVGDGMEQVQMIGHELGHGFNDFTNRIGLPLSGGEAQGLNESNSDIWGAMSSFYLLGGGFANHSSTIPNTAGTWKLFERDMRKPSWASGHPDAWYSTLGNLEEHAAAGPNDRAFFFLAQGASSDMTHFTYSPYLPWGMTGIGNHKAARIWYDAMLFWAGDDTYQGARNACLYAAMWRFGVNSPEYRAVQNAYAGINVGKRASNYPTLPPSVAEQEPNDTSQSAQFIARPVAPKPAGAPDKVTVFGSGTNTDWFWVSLKAGQKITLRLNSVWPNDYDLFVYDGFNTLVDKKQNHKGQFDTIQLTAPSGLDPNQPQVFLIKVLPWSVSNGMYFLDVDFF